MKFIKRIVNLRLLMMLMLCLTHLSSGPLVYFISQKAHFWIIRNNSFEFKVHIPKYLACRAVTSAQTHDCPGFVNYRWPSYRLESSRYICLTFSGAPVSANLRYHGSQQFEIRNHSRINIDNPLPDYFQDK